MNQGQTKLLVVEDNPADRALYRVYLQHVPDLAIVEAEFGSDALDLCHTIGPDCILLDFTLPDMNGLEFMERLRAQNGGIPCAVVMLTGIADERVAVRAVNAGATDYVPKRENMEAVLEHSIFSAIDKHRLEKALEKNRLELARSEHLHRSLMKALPQLVWTARAPTSSEPGRLTFGNRQWWDYVGIPEQEGQRFDWNQLLHVDDRERWWRNWRNRTAYFDMEVRLKKADDQQYRWHLIYGVRLDSAPDAEWLGTCTDIEAQKRAEQAMVQRQKWDSIGLLAGGIAHDFNNLLVAILGGASYASDALPEDHALQPILQNVVTAGDRAAHLTRQLLAYAGKGAFFIQQVDLSAVVEQTCELVNCSVPNGVQLRVQTSPGLPKIESDSGQIQQVAMNLVLNAVESIPQNQGGAVFVKTFAEGSGEGEAAVVLEVRDTGRGMDPETQARIFDPFFTTKFTGRGLGLAAVQGILRSSGASIEVTSAPGKGSTFRVRFRAVPKRDDGPSASVGTERRTIPGAATILVIDDEPTVLTVCQAALERTGCNVLLSHDGPHALQQLAERGSEIRLILLDLGMPGMNGRQVLEKIRAGGATVPVIVFSGYSEKEVAREFQGLNISSFLQKPFLATRLTAQVAEVLNPRGGAALQVAS